MSTVKKDTFQKRLAILANFKQKTFHVDDLARIWGIENKNTLHTTLKRYSQKGLIKRVHRGFYIFGDIDNVEPVALGLSSLHSYSYLSTESVLVRAGAIFQKIDYITIVSNKSLRFEIGENKYFSRQLKDDFLFNKTGIIVNDGINVASTERAVADLLYFNKDYFLDNPKAIDWKKVKEIQNKLGYK